MTPLFIVLFVVTLMIFLSYTPLFLAGAYIIMRPLLQPLATQQYELFDAMPIVGLVPVAIIGFSLFICIYRSDYIFFPPNSIFLYLLLVFSLASLINTPDLMVSISHLLKLLTAIAIYTLVYNSVKSHKDGLIILGAVVISSLGPMIVGYYQFFFNKGNTGMEHFANRIHGGLGEPNAYGVFLALCICATLAMFLSIQSKNIKILMVFLLSSMIISSFLALNRGSWIALSLSTFASAIVYRKSINFKIFVLIFLFIGVLFSNTVINRFSQLGDTAQWGGNKNTLVGRVHNWQRVLKIIPKHILVGHGIGTTEIVMKNHYGIKSVPHNDFIRILLEMGVLGLPFYLIFIGKELLFTYKAHRNDAMWKFNFPILIVILYWIIISFVQNNIYNVNSFPIFMALIALSRKFNLISNQNIKDPSAKRVP